MSHSLTKLLAEVPGILSISGEGASGQSDGYVINGVVYDSRQVQPGNLFVALLGGMTDGHRYIADAIQRGACAVVGMQSLGEMPVPYVQVQDSRQALACLSAAYNDFPARHLMVVGVTGTDGKTTTTNLIYSILQAAGLRTGMISTVNAIIGERVLDTGFHVTTPEAPDVQRYLAEMVSSGLTHVILEATSHGLDQHRVSACEFDLAVVTNITHEHLDYHGSFEAYRSAKARLFSGLADTVGKSSKPPRGAVLNLDDPSYEYLSGVVPAGIPQMSYGIRGAEPSFKFDTLEKFNGIFAQHIQYNRTGLNFDAIQWVDGKPVDCLPITSRLIGNFNVSNCLAAITTTRGLMDLATISVLEGIQAMPGIPGRMEIMDSGQDFTAIVDFAHTPNALQRVLAAVRQMIQLQEKPGRVMVVCGSAGLRDRQKRRMIAEIAVEFADVAIFTAEDPRTESLADILAEMARGASARGGIEGQNFWRIPDRREALRYAVHSAQPGDLVIACGKGHEQSMCFGTVEYPWDDRIALRAAIAERLGIPGLAMPVLPSV